MAKSVFRTWTYTISFEIIWIFRITKFIYGWICTVLYKPVVKLRSTLRTVWKAGLLKYVLVDMKAFSATLYRLVPLLGNDREFRGLAFIFSILQKCVHSIRINIYICIPFLDEELCIKIKENKRKYWNFKARIFGIDISKL